MKPTNPYNGKRRHHRMDCFVTLFLAMTLILMTACTDGTKYKRPTLRNSSAETMSMDTLCYRYASSKDPTLEAEVTARGLDCAQILESDPLYR